MSSSYREEIRREPVNNDQVVAVSGKHRCAHCGEELGRGAAMIIESLNLFYHLACFKCYSYQPDYRSRNYDSLRYGGQNDPREVDSSYTSTEYRRREQREVSPADYGRRDMSSSYREEIRREPVNN
ncbi:hypothetical protein OESDEN_19673, partial [Oesophagostomum dentatum]